jgi:N-methylhydantoinase B
MTFDPIELEVIKSRVDEAVLAMQNTLFHSGYSPVLREAEDGSAGITDANGGVIVGGGAPVHAAPYYRSVQAVLAAQRGRMKPGDCYLINDPFVGGNHHVPDTAIVSPFFYDGEIVAFCATFAHKPDFGGLVIGSSSPAAREIYHEGLLFPGTLFWSAEGPNRDVEAFLRHNTRSPDDVIGDLRAQVGAARLGCSRLTELFDRYGKATLVAAFEQLIQATERRIRAAIATLPDGEAEAEAFLDHDMVDFSRPVAVRTKLTKRGDRITLDFSGSDPNVDGPVNVRPQSVEAASTIAIISALDPSIEFNDGVRRTIEIINPPGTIANPLRPRPLNNYFPTLYLAYCVTQMALSKLAPDKASAPAGLGTGSVAFGYRARDTEHTLVQYELIVPSLGGTPHGDGAFIVIPTTHFTPMQPVEIVETESPTQVTRFEPIVDSAGPGKYRGGAGWRREYRVLEPCTFTIRTGHYEQGSWGVAGGGAPSLGCCIINPGTEREERLPVMATRQLAAGDIVRVELAGGGGYGAPEERDPCAVAADVQEQLISPEAALRTYKVAVDPTTLALDAAATARLRAPTLEPAAR